MIAMRLPLEIETRLEEIDREVGRYGAELVDISFGRARGRNVITLLVDKAGGVTLDECAQINGALSVYFDKLSQDEGIAAACGFLREPYYLEVNSPGLDRPLKTEKDFIRAAGETVRVVYKEADGKVSQATGEIYQVKEGVVHFIQPGDPRVLWVKLDAILKAAREIKIK